MYALDQYRGTSVSCRYAIPPNLIDPTQRTKLIDIVNTAISDNVLKHAVLQVGIANADIKRPIFVQLDSLDLRKHIDWRFIAASVDFDAALQELTALQLDATYPDLEKQPGLTIVVLPLPFSPTSATTSPAWIVKSRWRTAQRVALA